MQNIIAKIEAEFKELVKKTHNVWFKLLVDAQEGFEKTVHDISNKKTQQNDIESPTNIRPELEEAIRKLFSSLPMQFELTENKDLGEVIELLEVELKRF